MTSLTRSQVLQEIDRIEREMAAEFEARWNLSESECLKDAAEQVCRMRDRAVRRWPWLDTYQVGA